MHEVNTLRNVALKAVDAGIQQRLFFVRDVAEDVDRILDAVGTELNWDGEEVGASLLSNCGTAGDTREVNETRLDKALLALDRL